MNKNKVLSGQTSEFSTLGPNVVQEVADLITLMGTSQLAELDLEMPHMKLTIRKERVGKAVPGYDLLSSSHSMANFPSTGPKFAGENAGGPRVKGDSSENGILPAVPVPSYHEILSPMAGTFYRAPSPSSPSFVNEGDSVKLGQSVCIVEAMKLMNEIKADKAGKIVRILVENSKPVEKGTVLFHIEEGK
jgi:acetyl-CoA carboxylase biotin carboxyl carrier protein